MSPKVITFVGLNIVIMRKVFLFFGLVMMITMSGNAQILGGRFGIKVGPTIDWASPGSTAVENEGARMGFNVGLVAENYFTEHVAISSGLNFSFLRMKYEFTDFRLVEDFLEETDVNVSRQLRATNIQIPLKAKVKFNVADLFDLFAEAGAGLSFNVSDKGKDSYDFYWVSFDSDGYVDCTNQYRLLQFSMLVGVGAEYAIDRNFSAFAQLTLDHCFSNAFVSALEKQTGSVLRNNFVGLEVGILF